METRKVIVGIVTYNRYDLLIRAIESAILQNYSNFEIAVFDNGSNDNTYLIEKKYIDIKYQKSNSCLSIVEAKNDLMKKLDYEYFFWLDDDAWFLNNNIITDAVDFLENNKNVGALALDILSPFNKESVFKNKIPFQSANFVEIGRAHV